MLGRSLRYGEGIKGGMCIYLYKSSPKGWCVHHLSKSLTRVVESTTTTTTTTTTVGEMSEESDESVKLSRRRSIAIWSNEYCNQTYLSIVFPVEFIELKEDAMLGYRVLVAELALEEDKASTSSASSDHKCFQQRFCTVRCFAAEYHIQCNVPEC